MWSFMTSVWTFPESSSESKFPRYVVLGGSTGNGERCFIGRKPFGRRPSGEEFSFLAERWWEHGFHRKVAREIDEP